MNPVGAEGNIFGPLFDKVPAKRAGTSEDLAGTILYLVSKAGVSKTLVLESLSNSLQETSRMWTVFHFV